MIEIEKNICEIENADIKNIFAFREKNSNKGDFGKCGLIGGSKEYSGALKLANASMVSVRSGVGIVRVIIRENIVNYINPYLLEQTLFILDDNISDAVYGLDSIGIGMGWGREPRNKEILGWILNNYSGNVVIDADGLNTLVNMGLNILKKSKSSVVLTPHLKEFSRLCGNSIEDIKENSIEIAKSFAQEYGVILLLKGSTTIITDGVMVYLVKRGCAGMATAGSGDVLSGILTGLLAYNDYSLLTVASGAYLAGVAGEIAEEKYTDIAMKASDTIEFIPSAIKLIRDN